MLSADCMCALLRFVYPQESCIGNAIYATDNITHICNCKKIGHCQWTNK